MSPKAKSISQAEDQGMNEPPFWKAFFVPERLRRGLTVGAVLAGLICAAGVSLFSQATQFCIYERPLAWILEQFGLALPAAEPVKKVVVLSVALWLWGFLASACTVALVIVRSRQLFRRYGVHERQVLRKEVADTLAANEKLRDAAQFAESRATDLHRENETKHRKLLWQQRIIDTLTGLLEHMSAGLRSTPRRPPNSNSRTQAQRALLEAMDGCLRSICDKGWLGAPEEAAHLTRANLFVCNDRDQAFDSWAKQRASSEAAEFTPRFNRIPYSADSFLLSCLHHTRVRGKEDFVVVLEDCDQGEKGMTWIRLQPVPDEAARARSVLAYCIFPCTGGGNGDPPPSALPVAFLVLSNPMASYFSKGRISQYEAVLAPVISGVRLCLMLLLTRQRIAERQKGGGKSHVQG